MILAGLPFLHAPWVFQSTDSTEEPWPFGAGPRSHYGALARAGSYTSSAQGDDDRADLPTRPVSGKTAEHLASHCPGAADRPALQHSSGQGGGRCGGGGAGEAVYVLPQMLPPNRTAPSTTSQALPHPIYEYRTETFRVRSEVNFLELLSQQQCQLAKRETGSGGSSRLSKILGER